MLGVRDLRRSGLGPVSLTVEKGECVTVSGPSGAGKSLLLRAIADLDPNEGVVTLDDIRRESLPGPEWRRRVGYVPAESGWWTETVGGHFDDSAHGVSLLPRLGFPDDALAWQVGRLSTGERQRLALIRALGTRPSFLLLDEPTASLDPEATAAVEGLLSELRAGGAGILMVTHDPAQARRVADRRLRIRDGQIVEARP